MSTTVGRAILAAAAAAGLIGAMPAAAQDDPVAELANILCAAPDWATLSAALATVTADDAMSEPEVAEAFGVATFLGDLGRCANRQALADGFAFYKKGKDAARLDAAFAMGRVAAKPEGGGTASAEIYQGSFATLATAGDPPSGQ